MCQHLLRYDAICVLSPSRLEGEEKDQDRISWNPEQLLACVCDGVTDSPFAGEAAKFVAENVLSAFSESTAEVVATLSTICKKLLELRSLSYERPISFDETIPESFRDILKSVVAVKRQRSYQTTLAGLHILPSSSDSALVRAFWCGDSGIFAFTPAGSPVWSNLNILSDFRAKPSLTDCLPDNLKCATSVDFGRDSGDAHKPLGSSFARDTQFLLATDGFYSAFADFRDLAQWICSNQEQLKHKEARDDLLGNLHFRLSERVGDDDISFILLSPTELASP